MDVMNEASRAKRYFFKLTANFAELLFPINIRASRVRFQADIIRLVSFSLLQPHKDFQICTGINQN